MKKLIAIILVVAMVAAFVPATFATEASAEKAQVTADKSQFTKDIDHIERHGIDNYGNEVERRVQSSAVTDYSEINKSMLTLSNNTKGWAMSTHYGVEFFDDVDSFDTAYQMEKSDFPVSNDFLNSGAETYGMFFSPADSVGLIDDTGFHSFRKGDSFWVNFDLISGYNSSIQAPTYFEEDAEVDLYMYSGSMSDWQSDGGLPLTGMWQGMTKVSTKVTSPANGTIFMFFVVMRRADLQDIGADSSFGGWLQIGEYTTFYKNAKVQGTIVPNKQYSTDLGGPASQMLLLYGDDIGNVLGYGSLYEVQLKAGDKYALEVESGDQIGARTFLLDENKDMMTGTFIGTGSVQSGYSYDSMTWPIFPTLDGTYYILVAGFYAGDEGELNFELVDYEDSNATLRFEDFTEEIDVSTFGTQDIIAQTPNGEDAWAYFWYADFGMGALILAYPGQYNITGEKADMYVEAYDDVHMNMKDASVSTVWICSTWAPVTINCEGKCRMTDNYFGSALLNDVGYYGSLYIFGESLEVMGEKSCGALLECPTHVGLKTLEASATAASGSFSVAFWVTSWRNFELTWGKNASFKDSTGAALKSALLYFDDGSDFLNGYTVSQYAVLHRYLGDPNYYYIADYFLAKTEGFAGSGPAPVLIGDANQDGVVNTGDATAVLKHAAGLVSLTGDALVSADMNQDGNVNTGDATAILKSVLV